MAQNMAIAERSLFDAGEVMTQFVVMASERVFLIATPWENPESRAKYYQLMYLFCHAENATAVTMIAEVWTRFVPRQADDTDSKLLKRASQQSVSQAADKREALIVATAYRDADDAIKTLLAAREIMRDDTGKPIRTEPFSFGGAAPVDPILEQLLPPAALTEPMRFSARGELTLAQIRFGMVLRPQVIVSPEN